MKKEKYFDKALSWVQQNGFSEVKANHEDYPQPTSFSKTGADGAIVPDITGLKQGAKSYIEISTKTDNHNTIVTRWKLLSTLANRKGGQLVLLAPRGHKSFTQRLIEQYFIPARVISI